MAAHKICCMNTVDTPICIVGAGPAGATASLFLSQYGVPHLLVDRDHFPKEKVCGENFSGRVRHVLRELNPEWEQEMVDTGVMLRSRQLRFALQPVNRSIHLKFSAEATPVFRAQREVFDHWLFRKAQQSGLATCMEGVDLTKIERTEQGILLSTKDGALTINARLAIFCTGERMPLLERLFGKSYANQGNLQIFLRRYYRGIRFPSEASAYEAHFVVDPTLHFMLISPLPNDLALVEIGMPKATAQRHNIKLEALFERTLRETPELCERFRHAEPIDKGRGIAMLLGPNPRLASAERVLLAGSALGSIHPITGYGVGHAMRSAQMAAYWAAESLKTGDASAGFLRQYDRQLKRSMRGDWRLGQIILLASRNAWIALPLFKLALRSQGFTEALSDPNYYRNALNPLFYLSKMWKSQFGRGGAVKNTLSRYLKMW